MKKLSLFISLLLLQAIIVTAQKITPATPEAAGFSSERLARIDREMNDWVQKGWIQGSTAIIIRNGKIAYHKAAGYNDLEAKTPMQKDNIFRIASQTKAITSVAVMILFEEGKLLLDDPVSKYIPAFKKQQVLDKFNPADTTWTAVPAKSEITIRQLLTHTSGLGYAQIGSKEANAIYAKSNLTAGIGVKDDNLLDAMNRLAQLPLMHQPGEKWTYGLNTDLLGCLVEVISGMSLDKFFKTRIFEPLGMNDTYFTIPKEKANRLVSIYREDKDGKLQKSTAELLNGKTVTPDYPLEKSTYYSGGAGLSSTIYDYAVFLQMLLNNGVYNGKRILGRNTVRMMTMNQIGDLSRGDDKFGLGFQVVTERGSARTPSQAGTFSWGGAFATSYWVDPKEKMVFLLYRQLQSSTHGDVGEKFRSMTYAAIND
ncbi:MAG TPA: serine hydrolase domain-containing protein [Chitinophagaceae bacterium]|jgi:CubicO group peptidase (beta-lactamase class C family)|nr:serine hydrolase domain-containing protein [Chitinophagaceae bacterium]HMU58344.1 serine hydrolase domain-containing protein [Chitinophagaceae bacterium]